MCDKKLFIKETAELLKKNPGEYPLIRTRFLRYRGFGLKAWSHVVALAGQDTDEFIKKPTHDVIREAVERRDVLVKDIEALARRAFKLDAEVPELQDHRA